MLATFRNRRKMGGSTHLCAPTTFTQNCFVPYMLRVKVPRRRLSCHRDELLRGAIARDAGEYAGRAHTPAPWPHTLLRPALHGHLSSDIDVRFATGFALRRRFRHHRSCAAILSMAPTNRQRFVLNFSARTLAAAILTLITSSPHFHGRHIITMLMHCAADEGH